MKKYTKGRRLEYKTRDALIAIGFFVIRSAGSKGAFDLVAVSSDSIRLVQIKANKFPSKKEVESMLKIPIPPNGTREVWRWDDYVREPKIKVLQ